MKVILLLIMFLLNVLLSAQATASWGTKIGMNLAQHYGTKGDEGDYEVKTRLRPGFIGGMFVEFAASENLSLGFEALYTQKGSKEKISISRMELDGVIEELSQPATMDVKYYLDYLEIPVLFKLKTMSFPKCDLVAIAGTAMAVKVKGYHELDGTVYLPDQEGGSMTLPIWEESSLSDINMFDFSFVYGGALNFQAKYPVSLEYRFTLGWDYLYLPTYKFFEPVALRNQTWSVLLCTTF
ncbi:MAG: outer membrane beta-barrel protein [Candidatus Cloacimonetes bacterium]|nr:outer membrane beta-barrel protein [Candidatus Cloacimonadota bacterium]